MMPICFADFDLCPSRYATRSISTGRIPELKAKTKRGEAKVWRPTLRKLFSPSFFLMAYINGVS
jgi:hypothetical protein